MKNKPCKHKNVEKIVTASLSGRCVDCGQRMAWANDKWEVLETV